jgi:hypothetical protein
MRIHRLRNRAGRVRPLLLVFFTVVLSGAGVLVGSGVSQARTRSPGIPHGWAVIDSCSSVAGQIIYSPGLLRKLARNQETLLSGTTSGCSDIFNGAESGTGSITVSMAGQASLGPQSFSGTFTIDWPPSTGYDPSVGSLTITAAKNVLTISGMVNSGFDTGTVLAMQYKRTGNLVGKGTNAFPVTGQSFANTQPLTLSRDE